MFSAVLLVICSGQPDNPPSNCLRPLVDLYPGIFVRVRVWISSLFPVLFSIFFLENYREIADKAVAELDMATSEDGISS